MELKRFKEGQVKIILINPDYMLYGDPPLGLASLAAYLKKECSFIDIRIFDQIKEGEMLKKILKEEPHIVGISAVSQNYYKVIELAKKIRKVAPSSILILGGVHITALPSSFKDSPFDLAIRGEGEIPFKKFADSFYEIGSVNTKKLSKIPGFLLRDKEKIIDTGLSEMVPNLDDIPLPARNLLNMNYYRLPRFSSKDLEPAGAIITSRGCPYSCKFCASSVFWRRTIRFFSAKRVVDEIKILHHHYGYNLIEIYDDLFSINKERLREIVFLLEKEGLLGKIRFILLARANCFDEETAMLFKKMNPEIIAFGFETGSPKMLRYLKGDNVKIDDALRAISLTRKYNLPIKGFFMVGSPTETIEDMNQTYDFIEKNHLDNALLFQTKAYPGTEIWDYAIKTKVLREDFYDSKQKDFIEIDTDLLLSKEINKGDFIAGFNKIRALINTKTKKTSNISSRFLLIRPHHIRLMLTREFLEKANILKTKFYKNFILR